METKAPAWAKVLLASSHPLPDDATRCRRFAQGFLCPPSGKVAAVILVLLMFALWWAALYSIAKKEVLPGGNLFPMLILFMFTWCGGYIFKLTPLPPLLGMLIVGFILGNVDGINVARKISPQWSSTARSIALAIILIRAGLGLDPDALKRLSFVVLRLAFVPSICEVVADGLVAHFLLGMPWTWAFMLGFVLAVVSPAVVVPSMLSLSDRGYGLNKGIPTLIIAACSLDAVLAITGFGVLLGISFSQGDVVWNSFKGPLEAVAGIVYGCLMGFLLWFIPAKSSKNLILFRSVMLVGGGLLAIFGSKAISWSGSGPLGCLSIAFIAGLKWRKEYQTLGMKNPVEEVASVLWMLFMPLLFGLIGAAVHVESLESQTVGYGVAVLFVGLVTRVTVAALTTLRTDFNLKERIFVPLAWIPKATVQAAIGAVAYDTAVERGAVLLVPLGKQVLTLAVLAIVIAAPIGSLVIALAGPRLLHRSSGTKEDGPDQLKKEKTNSNNIYTDEEKATVEADCSSRL